MISCSLSESRVTVSSFLRVIPPEVDFTSMTPNESPESISRMFSLLRNIYLTVTIFDSVPLNTVSTNAEKTNTSSSSKYLYASPSTTTSVSISSPSLYSPRITLLPSRSICWAYSLYPSGNSKGSSIVRIASSESPHSISNFTSLLVLLSYPTYFSAMNPTTLYFPRLGSFLSSGLL